MDPDENQASASPRNRSMKACANCARLKCRCIPRTGVDGTGCERCHRLHKICVPTAPAQQRRRPRPHVVSRSARLEEKLDDLVSILRAQHGGTVYSERSDEDGDDSENDGLDIDVETSPPSITVVPSTTPGEVYLNEPSPIEADDSLGRFRDGMLSFTPYVHIPPNVPSLQLRRTFPFLWLNIMSVTSKSVQTRNSLSKQARDVMLHNVVAGSERSLDLLLGILTFVNWVHLFPIDKRFASLASQLAVALVCDLGLHMPSAEDSPPIRPPIGHAPGISQQPCGKERTMEEKRAVLGAFVITSTASQCFKAADGLRWSSHLEEYLVYLAHHSHVPHDQVLVGQVKMILIVNQVRHSSLQNGSAEIPAPFVDALQSQVDDVAEGLNRVSFQSGSKSMALWLYHSTTLLVNESAMMKPRVRAEPAIRRYEVYQRCLNSTKAWLDVFFSVPLDMYTCLPCRIYCQLFYVVGCLRKITTTRDTAWDPSAARGTVDLVPTLDRIIHTFEQLNASATAGSARNQEDEVLTFGLKKFYAFKMAWQSDPSEAASSSKDRGGGGGGGGGAFPQASMPVHGTDAEGSYNPTLPMEFFGINMLPSLSDDDSWL